MSAGGTDGSMVHFKLFIQPNSTNCINCLTVRAGNGALCMSSLWISGTPHHHPHLTGQWGTYLHTGKGGNRGSTAQENAWVTLQITEDVQRLIQASTWLWNGFISTAPLAEVSFLNVRMSHSNTSAAQPQGTGATRLNYWPSSCPRWEQEHLKCTGGTSIVPPFLCPFQHQRWLAYPQRNGVPQNLQPEHLGRETIPAFKELLCPRTEKTHIAKEFETSYPKYIFCLFVYILWLLVSVG